jgi:hypothetical protein
MKPDAPAPATIAEIRQLQDDWKHRRILSDRQMEILAVVVNDYAEKLPLKKSPVCGRKLVVSYCHEQLELFPVGTPNVTYNDRFAFQNHIARDKRKRVFSVEIRQRLFREEKLRVTTRRIRGRLGEATAENCARLSEIVAREFAKEGR